MIQPQQTAYSKAIRTKLRTNISRPYACAPQVLYKAQCAKKPMPQSSLTLHSIGFIPYFRSGSPAVNLHTNECVSMVCG